MTICNSKTNINSENKKQKDQKIHWIIDVYYKNKDKKYKDTYYYNKQGDRLKS